MTIISVILVVFEAGIVQVHNHKNAVVWTESTILTCVLCFVVACLGTVMGVGISSIDERK